MIVRKRLVHTNLSENSYVARRCITAFSFRRLLTDGLIVEHSDAFVDTIFDQAVGYNGTDVADEATSVF